MFDVKELIRGLTLDNFKDRFVAESSVWQQIFLQANKIAQQRSPLLISGYTGTGKNLLAYAIHGSSRRPDRCVTINCAGISPHLLESELFGCNKGAFTGAYEREGLVAAAGKGTVILDEIHALGYEQQTALLHLVEEGSYRKVGCNAEFHTNARIIGVTNRNLEKEVAAGKFREDLLYRFVYTLDIPPLNARPEDVIPLIRYYLKASPFNADGRTKLVVDKCERQVIDHPWPGNARMIVQILERMLSHMEDWDDQISTEQILDWMPKPPLPAATPQPPVAPDVAKFEPAPVSPPPSWEDLTHRTNNQEVDLITGTLNKVRWNRKQAAAALKLDYKALLYKMKKLGIEEGRTDAPAKNGDARIQ